MIQYDIKRLNASLIRTPSSLNLCRDRTNTTQRCCEITGRHTSTDALGNSAATDLADPAGRGGLELKGRFIQCGAP